MDNVDVKILQNNNTVLKLIHGFDKSIPIMEIRRRLAESDTAVSYDLDAHDVMDTEETAHEHDLRLLTFLAELHAAGADFTLTRNGRPETMEHLKNWIHTREGIRQDCEKYPD